MTGETVTLRHPAVPFVLPFAVFMLLLAVSPYLGLPDVPILALRVITVAIVIYLFSRGIISWKMTNALGSVAVGVLVFVIWIGPDALIPGYRNHWLFQNSITGTLKSSLNAETLMDPLALALRSLRAIVLVPIAEELFWRGWLMRWLINPDFEKVAPGTYDTKSFWITAVLFASVHGPYWEVGLIAGAIYNGWMVRTKSWNDCILAHAVTNACLAGYVIMTGRWEYWL